MGGTWVLVPHRVIGGKKSGNRYLYDLHLPDVVTSPTFLLPKGTFHKINLNSTLTAALPYELRHINLLLYV